MSFAREAGKRISFKEAIGMMPFSVLRTWFSGILGWAILLGGIYCIWKWSQERGFHPANARAISEVAPAEDLPERQAPVERKADDNWPLLAAGIALLAFSGLGMFPVTLLLGRPGGRAAHEPQNRKAQWIERPDGSRLYVQTFGSKDGPTLLFTHGWSLESTVWDELCTRLGNRFRFVVWDLAGLGQSKRPSNGDHSLEKMAEDLAAVVREAGGRDVILIGHSIGGMITQTFCRLHPEELTTRVNGLVLLQTTYTNPLQTALFAPFWRAIEKPILVPMNHMTVWLAPLAWLSNMQGFLNGSLHIMTRIASLSGKQTWGQLHHGAWLAAKAWPAVISRGNLAMVSFNEEETLRKIDVPVLILGGDHDRMTKPSASEHIERLAPRGVLSMIPCGHLGFWEEEGRIAELIGEFAERYGMADRSRSSADDEMSRSRVEQR
jgi:pimeloyl-ACP methyl ester carboxylesterase